MAQNTSQHQTLPEGQTEIRTEEELWQAIIDHQNYQFYTMSGLPYSYTVNRGWKGGYTKELIIDRRKNSKSLTWCSIRQAFSGALEKKGQIIEKPKALGDIRGVSYIYPLLWKFGVIEVPPEFADKMSGPYTIAIDGPSGAGKSSMAKLLAKRFNFLYVDTGAIYRTLALAAIRAGIDVKNSDECMALFPTLNFAMRYNEDGEQRMFLNDEDVSEMIRMPEVSVAASDVSSHADVRKFLLEMQRQLARENNVVMDGRDIGTVILPNAKLKIFLTASDTARAERRFAELTEKGVETSFEDVLKDIRYRDEQDTTRAAAPLMKAEDAVVVDSSELSFDETIERLTSIVIERFYISEEK